MCGLLFTNDEAVPRDEFLGALRLLTHRGPDAEGHAVYGPARLGHRRLKILDLDDRSNQPFLSADGRYAAVYNGEIYNFAELARQHDIPRRTTSDTEVLVELYARHGAACLGWLNGMFALVIVDTQTRDVFAARDRLGVKPLYLHRRGDVITLASEIAPVLALTGVSRFDEVGLRQYRKLRTFFNGRTAYAGVEMFPAGHYFERGRFHRYWDVPAGPQAPPSDEELRGLVADAVRQRLVADVPVGSYLSGGLDSTIVAMLARTPHTWTVGFRDCNEFEWGRTAAAQLGSEHHEVLIEPEEFVPMAADMIRRRREPLSVPNEVLLWAMTREVRRHNTVVLSGEGADELFFGYDRIFRWAEAAPAWDLAAFSRLYAYGSVEDLEIVEDAVAPFLDAGRPIDIVAKFFQVAHLHGLLRRLDHATMLCGVEARTPFVDHHPLIERMAGVAFGYRMERGEVKSPLKRVFRDLVPPGILNRPKVGFPVPLERVLPPAPSTTGTLMDHWLAFNLAALTGEEAAA
jgi:asparagine synthase (glutamine-hydrolysing)